MNSTIQFKLRTGALCLFVALLFLVAQPVQPASAQQGSDADLAQELTNPLADLMTIPIQMNYDSNIGVQDQGSKLQTNIQPVVPFSMNPDWNVITRTIVPVTWQEDIFPERDPNSAWAISA